MMYFTTFYRGIPAASIIVSLSALHYYVWGVMLMDSVVSVVCPVWAGEL